MKKITTILGAAALITSTTLGLTACGEQQKNAAPTELKKVTLMLDWTPNTNHTGFFVAKENGYYKDAGLDVEIKQPPEDGGTPLVSEGKAQFGIDFQEYLASAVKGGANVTTVATILQHNTVVLLSKKEKNIVSGKDLEGKTVIYGGSPNSLKEYEQVVVRDGGDPAKVKWIDSVCEDVVACLQNPQTDVVADQYYGWGGMQAEVAGVETNAIWVNPENKDNATLGENDAMDFYSPVLIANKAYWDANTAEAKKFVEATAKGFVEAAKNPAEGAEILALTAPGVEGALVKKSQEYLSKHQYLDANGNWGTIDQGRWDKVYKWMFDNGLLKDVSDEPLSAGFGLTAW